MIIYRLTPDADSIGTGGTWPVYDHLPSQRELLSVDVGNNPTIGQRPYGVITDGGRWAVELISLNESANLQTAMEQAEKPAYDIDHATSFTDVVEWVTGQTPEQVRAITILAGSREWPTPEFTRDGECWVTTVTTHDAVTVFRVDPSGVVTFRKTVI